MIRLFGHIENGVMIPNQFGSIVENEWYLAANLREQVELHEDEFVLMPNHIHGIIWILESADSEQHSLNRSSGIKSNSLGAIVSQFKTQTTKKINHLRNSIGTSVWQRNYYDHIIRNDKDLLEIKKYILENPFKWED
jgi:REP element-mobilizing transposase RayT